VAQASRADCMSGATLPQDNPRTETSCTGRQQRGSSSTRSEPARGKNMAAGVTITALTLRAAFIRCLAGMGIMHGTNVKLRR